MLCDQVLNNPANGFVVIEFRNGTVLGICSRREIAGMLRTSRVQLSAIRSGLGHGGKDPGRMPSILRKSGAVQCYILLHYASHPY